MTNIIKFIHKQASIPWMNAIVREMLMEMMTSPLNVFTTSGAVNFFTKKENLHLISWGKLNFCGKNQRGVRLAQKPLNNISSHKNNFSIYSSMHFFILPHFYRWWLMLWKEWKHYLHLFRNWAQLRPHFRLLCAIFTQIPTSFPFTFTWCLIIKKEGH